jgi:N-acetylneuraminic acid mutarotase
MVVFGGIQGIDDYPGLRIYNDAWALDLTTFAWALLTTTGTKPIARNGHSSVVSNGKMVVFGGHNDGYKNDAWTLDLTTLAWTLLTTTGTKPSVRIYHSSVLYNGKMVVFGGSGADASSRYDDTWTLDLKTLAWTLLTTTETKPSARTRHSSIVSNGKMVVFGGCGSKNNALGCANINDAWTLNLVAPTATTTKMENKTEEDKLDASTRASFSFVPALLLCVVAFFA